MADAIHSGPTTIQQRLEMALTRELKDGESVVWQGMKLARVEPKGFLIYLFAIPWTGFALFWMAMAGLFSAGSRDTFGMIFPLFGLPFVLIGLAMMSAPFLSFFQRGRVLFAVTNTRVLKLSLGRQLVVNSVPASKIDSSIRRESSDGTGAIDLTLSKSIEQYGGNKSRKMAFGRVENVFAADKAISELTD